MTSMPEKQDEGFGFSLAEAKKRREEKDAREKWERDVERLAAELLSQHTAEELAVIAAQHIIYKEAIEALNVERRWCTINKRLYNNGLDSEILA